MNKYILSNGQTIYCGAKNPPKNARYGTQSECEKKGQIRLFGLKEFKKEEKKKMRRKVKSPYRQKISKPRVTKKAPQPLSNRLLR